MSATRRTTGDHPVQTAAFFVAAMLGVGCLMLDMLGLADNVIRMVVESPASAGTFAAMGVFGIAGVYYALHPCGARSDVRHHAEALEHSPQMQAQLLTETHARL